MLMFMYMHICMFACALPNNLLKNSYFANSTPGLHVLCIFNTHDNGDVNRILIIIQSINSFLCIILNYKNLNLNN